MVLTAVLVEGLWWLLSNTLSFGGLIVALVLGTLIVVRMVVAPSPSKSRNLR